MGLPLSVLMGPGLPPFCKILHPHLLTDDTHKREAEKAMCKIFVSNLTILKM